MVAVTGRHRATREDYEARHLAAGDGDRPGRVAELVDGVQCTPIGSMADTRRDPRLYAGGAR